MTSQDGRNPARDIIERLDSYTEVSPSGTGYHVLVEGELPEGRNRCGGIELYDRARFFTVTGDHVGETPDHVARRQDALVAIHREYVQDNGTEDTADSKRRDAPDRSAETHRPTAVTLGDEELLEKARNASNGRKFERLWNGGTSGYESQSEADMALCFLLAFWTGGDNARVDRLFRQSGLYREKWDEVHYGDGLTYGEKTVERAVRNTSEFYEPGSGMQATGSHADSETSPTDAGRDESSDSHAYLPEKNRLLADRVDELEASIERKDERIDTLEAEIEWLTAELADYSPETNLVHEERATDAGGDDETVESASVWSQIKRWLGSDSR